MSRTLALVALAWLPGFLLGSLAAAGAKAERTGIVFVDADADGVRDEDEAGRVGIAVTNGRAVVVTGPDGRYVLPDPAHGFVSISCPADADCPVWFHRRADAANGDFAVLPADRADDFFFIHLSDAHVYPRVADIAGLLPSDGLPWYLPRPLVGWFLLRMLDRSHPNHSRDEIAAAFRAAVSPFRDVEDAWDVSVMMDYVELSLDPATGLIEPEIEIPRAFAEVAGLSPAFAIHTGDMILEGNRGEPEDVERWVRYYGRVSAAEELKIYATIGNNELAGTENDSFLPSHPLYGKALFRREFGPTHFSFDHGAFHFAAVDTHKPRVDLAEDPEGEWTFYEMEPEVRDWLDADLEKARAAGLQLVVLNHEPFHYDPVWDFDDPTPADDEGLFDKHGVAYSLAGHIHRNGFQDAPEAGGVTHITTGALSGFRWLLPLRIDSRGYRLFYARGRKLYSAWKEIGEPLLGFVDPRGDATIHPASSHASLPNALEAEAEVDVVAVGVDVDQPFASLTLWLDGEPLEAEPWGDYFVRARFDAARLQEDSALALRATARDGSAATVRLGVARTER